jgi:hypothetical protein
MRAIMALTGAALLGAIAGKLGSALAGTPGAILFATPAAFVGFHYGRKWFDEYLGD